MKMYNLDEILSSEEPLIPSCGFVSAVMSRVQSEASQQSKIAFPWHRFAAAIAIGILTGLIVYAVLGWHSGPLLSVSKISDPAIRRSIVWVTVSMAITLPLAWLSIWITDVTR
jgi:hypothetical protein